MSSQAEHSCLRRQLAEVEAIRAMYPEDGEFVMTEAEAMALETLEDLDYSKPFPNFTVISFTLHLLATNVGGRHVSVCFSFPRHYPETATAKVSVECGGRITKQQHEIISLGAQAAADEMVGNEAVFQVLQRVQELALEIKEATTENASLSASNLAGSKETSEVKQHMLHRKLIWFHHIKPSQKRKHIVDWGSELGLGGFSKPGFPGVLIVEGESADVAEYVKRLQRLRWQAMQIRGEELAGAGGARKFPVGITELQESGMSELAAKCREANLEELFLTALKISK